MKYSKPMLTLEKFELETTPEDVTSIQIVLEENDPIVETLSNVSDAFGDVLDFTK